MCAVRCFVAWPEVCLLLSCNSCCDICNSVQVCTAELLAQPQRPAAAAQPGHPQHQLQWAGLLGALAGLPSPVNADSRAQPPQHLAGPGAAAAVHQPAHAGPAAEQHRGPCCGGCHHRTPAPAALPVPERQPCGFEHQELSQGDHQQMPQPDLPG